MPCKNEIDFYTRKATIESQLQERFDLNNPDFDTVRKCLIDINICEGFLSVSQLYRALGDYEPNEKVFKNQLKMDFKV